MWEIPVPGRLCVPPCRRAAALGSRHTAWADSGAALPLPKSRVHHRLPPQHKRIPSFRGWLPRTDLPESAQGGTSRPHPTPWVRPEPVPASEMAVPVWGCTQQLLPSPRPGMEMDEPSPKRTHCPYGSQERRRWGKLVQAVPASLQP